MTLDALDVAAIRERVLAGWSAAPVRFREDANAEEDFALGGYRDRLIVELAQNAADAAARAGQPGRLLLALRHLGGHPVLVAANTGAPLDADGVQALATLRASAKRGEAAVGRFGVGFAAVLAVTDEPAVLSRTGGVRFSAGDTRALVVETGRTSPGLVDELARREGHVPVLRVPFLVEGEPPHGYETAVVLPLRDALAEEIVGRHLDEVDDALLLALPGLVEVVIETPDAPSRVLRDVESRWHVQRRSGRLAAELLADRPTEERARPGWQIAWALPRTADARVPAVLHAPTPTEEPLPWPALLVASFPLESSRRHVAPGPATRALVGEAAAAFADLLAGRASAGADVLPLVPTGLPSGALDGLLREAVLAVLPGTPLLPAAEDARVLLRPRDALVLDPPAGADAEAVAALAVSVAGLVHAPVRALPALDALGVPRTSLADLVDALPAVADPAHWAAVYAALAGLAVDPLAREALSRLPVPLADGRMVRGARGAVLPVRSGPADVREALAAALAVLRVRAVHPLAAHELLETLGAVPADPRGLLDVPAVRAAVVACLDEDGPDPDEVADAVLALASAAVSTGSLNPGELGWLADLPLRDSDGELAPAGALALPGSAAARLLDPDEIGLVAAPLVDAWGEDVLAAVGVLSSLAAVVEVDLWLEDAAHGEGPLAEIDGGQEWARHALDEAERAGVPTAGAAVAELLAVRDLDAVREECWADALRLIADDPTLRLTLTRPVRVVAQGQAVDVIPLTAWWLRRRLARAVGAHGAVADPAASDVVVRLLPPAPGILAGLDSQVRQALGVVHRIAELPASAAPFVLSRLADSGVTLSASEAVAVYAHLAACGGEADPPDAVRVLAGAQTAVVPADLAVVVDAPALLQRADLGAPVVSSARLAPALAGLLDLPLASELAVGAVSEDGAATGQQAAVPADVLALVPGAPAVWCEHEVLLVDGVEVTWWVTAENRVHASTVEGLARGLAWAGGVWTQRHAVAALLAEPGRLGDLIAESAF